MIEFVSPKELRRLGILGMNRRNLDYIGQHNPRYRYPIVDNKLKTKEIAVKHGIAVPELYGVVDSQYQVKQLPPLLAEKSSFVIKPVQGSGGKGILVITGIEQEGYRKPSGAVVHESEVIRHVSNILAGLHSLGGRNDYAMIEALIEFDPGLEQYSYEGVPDIRVIVYKGFPVMSMLRCSTHASDGKANLHQGAVGVGLDLQNGRPLYAVQNGDIIERHPDLDSPFSELKIPYWYQVLELAAHCAAMTELGYLGVDIVLDKTRGPMLLELNARPGLAIQVANQEGLRLRLSEIEKITNIDLDPEEKVQLAQRLFSKHPGLNLELTF